MKKLSKILPSRALGAAAAQVMQAVGSFGIQIISAWSLGAEGLGTISLCLSVIVVATALASGMIGDSLVILDRGDHSIRGALQALSLIVGIVSAIGSAVAMSMSYLSPLQAILFGVALFAFLIEELLRRIFMATMNFWLLIVLDGSAVVSSLTAVGLWAVFAKVSITVFLAALVIGQIVGLIVGALLLPEAERIWVPMKGTNVRKVLSFGIWRGAQVSMGQLIMMLVRMIVTAFAGKAALGMVEGARIATAPAILVVQGLGSYLLSGYVRDKAEGASAMVERARKASFGLMGLAFVGGGILVITSPYLGALVSGRSFTIDQLTVIGWVCYVVGSASFQPFASLAAVLGRQQLVFACRVVDTIFTILLLTAMLALGVSAAWTPFAVSLGLVLDGFLVRGLILRPLRKAERRGKYQA